MANFNLNKVILGGRVTADLELKQTQSGIATIQFSIAVNRRFTAKGTEDSQNNTDFINVRAWRQTAEFISRFFKKGSSICVVGSIQTRNWTDQAGVKHYATEVIADEAYFVDAKGENISGFGDAPAFQTQQAPKFEEISGDDDLPF
ncbi:MAG: single-stranded DNA-binding protein [Clostridia bacterium]|nr:single-stranded DNA-binding protein [Clostridia bacterium]